MPKSLELKGEDDAGRSGSDDRNIGAKRRIGREIGCLERCIGSDGRVWRYESDLTRLRTSASIAFE